MYVDTVMLIWQYSSKSKQCLQRMIKHIVERSYAFMMVIPHHATCKEYRQNLNVALEVSSTNAFVYTSNVLATCINSLAPGRFE